MVLKILGTGCPKCKKLEENARKAIAESGVEAEIIKVDQLEDIMSYGVMSTPALVVDEKVYTYGRIITVKEIRQILDKLAK